MSNYNEGDKVRHLPTGTVGYLTEINPNDANDPDDEFWARITDDPDGYGSYGTEIDLISDVELITAVKDLPVRKVPTRAEFAKNIGIETWDDYQHEETYHADPDAVEITFKTAEGLRVVAVVKVVDVYNADL